MQEVTTMKIRTPETGSNNLVPAQIEILAAYRVWLADNKLEPSSAAFCDFKRQYKK
jgi:hypothetical protein